MEVETTANDANQELEDGLDTVRPNQTIYINNLNERIKKEELRKSLYAMFSQFGTVLDVVALKTIPMKGQAFVTFKDIPSATNAMRAMTNFPFYDKPMKIQYAKKQSDIIAKLNGTYIPTERRKENKRKPEEAGNEGKRSKQKQEQPKKGDKKKKEEQAFNINAQNQLPSIITNANLNPKAQPPNKILFVENLPEQCTDLMLSMLFQQFAGYKEVRMVEGKKGIAFVEFESENLAGVAMTGLQHFKITPTHLMVISFAKR